MSKFGKLLAALQLLAKYVTTPEQGEMASEGSFLYFGPNPALVSEDDKVALRQLGVILDYDNECFAFCL